jgi:hypothetical protein
MTDNPPVTIGQLQQIATFLGKGLHKLAHEASPHFPYGVFTFWDGREILFNRGYTPLWERLANGTVQCADPCETPQIDPTYFFDDKYPWHQQYEGNKKLRALLVRWRFIATARDARREHYREEFARKRRLWRQKKTAS